MTTNEIILLLTAVVLLQTTYITINTFQKTSTSKRLKKPVFVDTSTLIDGRILQIAESGFAGGTLYVPRSVIGELQFLADNADSEKRGKARRGLDVISELQNIEGADIRIFKDLNRAKDGVDNQLLRLAKKHDGSICTIDFNLAKVAIVEGIQVLNVNDLAMHLRMAHLPGEKLMLELVQPGQDAHQAVGYLEDGTMVVVEHAHQQIGRVVEVEFIRSLQTAAGRMMFAKLVGSKNSNPKKTHNKSQSKKQQKPKV
jgi:uncharacterized protein YacL